MPKQVVKILSVTALNARIKAYQTEKPAGYGFQPGQAAEVGVNRQGWETEFRPFTFTSLPTDPYLEFNIKSYRDHEGVTKLLDTLRPGDELLVGSSWGDMAYKGPGLFVAGGTGITPFVSIWRQLEAQKALAGHRLYWANASAEDLFHEADVNRWLGGYAGVFGRADAKAVKKLLKPGDWVYLCGPLAFEADLKEQLLAMGVPAEKIVQEE